MNNVDIEPTFVVGVARPREATVKADNANEDNNVEDDNGSIMEIDLPPKPKIEPIDVDEYTDGDKGGDEDDFFGAEDEFFDAIDDDADIATDETGEIKECESQNALAGEPQASIKTMSCLPTCNARAHVGRQSGTAQCVFWRRTWRTRSPRPKKTMMSLHWV
jgi:hypothetical protein